jgi:hypothetical protein
MCVSAARAHAEESRRASRHFQAGLTAAGAGEIDRAMEEFQAAYTESPHYSVLFNIGQTYALMGKPVEAVEAFQRYLQEGGAAIAPSRRQAVESSIAFHLKRVGEVLIEVAPANATLEVDGQAPSTDWRKAPIRLVAGKHALVFGAPGFRTKALTATVEPGRRQSFSVRLDSVEAENARGAAQLRIGCGVPEVEVLVDGRRRGRTPLSEPLLVEAGVHQVRLVRAGYDEDTRVVESKSGELVGLVCRLRYASVSRGGAAAGLSVRPSSAQARTTLDGSPFTGGRLPAGRHRVEVQAWGHRPWRRDITLLPGATTVLEVSLQPEPAYVERYRANVERRRNWAYVVGAGGVAFGATAAVLWVVNGNRYDDWQEQKRALEASSPQAPDFQVELKAWHEQGQDIERLNGLTAGCAIASGALFTLGAAMWLGAGDPERYGRVTARLGKAGPELAWRAAW